MKIKQTKIKYIIQKCSVKYKNTIYDINLNYNSLLKKELNYIILKKLNKDIRIFYLYDIKIKNNVIIQAKESLEEIGIKVEIVSIEIVNKYYNLKKIITQNELSNYYITGLTNETEIKARNYFNKLSYKELSNYENIFPLYILNKKIELKLKNIFSFYFLNRIDIPIYITSINNINKINFNFSLNNIYFYFDKNKAIRINKFNHIIFLDKLKKLNKELNKIKQYLIHNNQKTHFLIKDLILFKENWKYGNDYYLNICGFEFNNNNFKLTNINNLKNTIIKIKLYKNFMLYKNIKIPLSYIDNNNISLHKNLEDAKQLNFIKLKFINNFIKEGEKYE